MTKIAKKKKDAKVKLSIKVHPSLDKPKSKNIHHHVLESPLKHKKTAKPKKKIGIFKKKKNQKIKGFLEKEISKKTVKKEKKIKQEQDFFVKNNSKEEKAKILLMKSGVTFFMLLIFVMWAYNTKRSIATSFPKDKNNILEREYWWNFSEKINEKIKEAKNVGEEDEFEIMNFSESENLELKNEDRIIDEVQNKISSSTVVVDNLKDVASSSEQIEKLKKEINKILK